MVDWYTIKGTWLVIIPKIYEEIAFNELILDGKFYNFNQQREFYSPFPELQELPYNLKSRREVIDAKAIKDLKEKPETKEISPRGSHAEGARADGCTSSNLLFDCSIFVIGKKNTSTI